MDRQFGVKWMDPQSLYSKCLFLFFLKEGGRGDNPKSLSRTDPRTELVSALGSQNVATSRFPTPPFADSFKIFTKTIRIKEQGYNN